MLMRAVLAAVLVLATAATAAAQAPGETYPTPDPPSTMEEKSGAAAVAFSMGGALLGVGLLHADPELGLVGLVIGPSVGRWYNHEIGALGMAARLGAVVIAIDGLENIDGGCEIDYTDAECAAIEQRQRNADRKILFGMALWGAATIYDFVQSGLGSERYNDEHRLQIAPTLVGRNTPGIGLGFVW